jgi:hypothetical protein
MLLSTTSSRGSQVKSMTVTDPDRRAGKFEQVVAKSLGLKATALEQPGRLLAAHSTMLNLHTQGEAR